MATVTDPRRRMVRRQIAGRGIADRRVLAAMREGAARGVRARGHAGVRLRGYAAADRGGPDDLAALHRRADDRGGRASARRPRARDRRRLGLCRGGAGARSPASVFTIERHRRAGRARRAQRLRQLGYDNVEVAHGDGTLRLARAGAVRRDPGRGRRPARARGLQGPARHRRPAGDAGRRDADAPAPDQAHAQRRRDLASRKRSRRGALRAADRRAGLVGRAWRPFREQAAPRAAPTQRPAPS